MANRYCTYCLNPLEREASCPVCGLLEGAYAPPQHHLPPGTMLLGRYLVGRALGEGGFGITYIGLDLRLELRVAIKEYFPTDRVTRMSQVSLRVTQLMGAEDDGFQRGKERFLYEARTLARMEKQPEIVTVRDYFEENGTAYIVMEYVEGTTFKSWVKQNGGRIPPEELFSTIEPLFGALDAVHRSGLIHRDISPDNLMLENGMVRLLDFGCARESAGGTKTMTVALKHGFAPVEQYQYKGQGPWTDVYSLAATIYYCLTGETPPQALDRMCDDELIPPQKLGIPLSEQQERALLRGLGIRPRRRFQSVEEFRAALYSQGERPEDQPEERHEEMKTEQAEPPHEGENSVPHPARRLTQWLKLAAVGVVAAGILAAALITHWQELIPIKHDIVEKDTIIDDQSEHFSIPEGGWNQIQLNVLRADESAFEEAKQVDSIDTLLQALEDPAVSAVVISGDIDLTIDVRQSKPVLVKEGATVTLTDTVSHTWKVVDSYLINRGTMRVDLQADEGGVIINEGDMELGRGELLQQAGFLNQGTVRGDTLLFYEGAHGFNFGTMESRETFHLLHSGTFFSNSGTLTVRSWGGVDQDARLENHETMVLEEEADFVNNSFFFHGNVLELKARSTMENYGLLRWSGGLITGQEDTAILGWGAVLYHHEICTIDGAVLVEPTQYFAKELSENNFDQRVSSEGALQSNMIQKISTEINGTASIQGDLEVTADLYISSHSTLEVSGTLTVAPGVTVYNEGNLTAGAIAAKEKEPRMALYNTGTLTAASLESTDQALFFNEGTAELQSIVLTNAAAVVNQGTLRCGARFELNGTYVYSGGEALLKESDITAENAYVFAAGNMQLSGATFRMQQGSTAVFTAPLRLDKFTAEIAEDGLMDFQNASLTIGDQVAFHNVGTLCFRGEPGWTNFAGDLINAGTVQVFSRYFQMISVLQNEGIIELWDGAQLRQGSEATVTGGGVMVKVTYDEAGNEIRTEQSIS